MKPLSRKILTAVVFAAIGAGLYWLLSVFGFSPWPNHLAADSGKETEFDVGTCLLFAAGAAVIGLLPHKDRSKTTKETTP